MILQAKYSMVANLVVVLWICFMVTHCPCAPPPYVEPIIYVTLARWENRTFSPRIFYVMMSRQQQQQSNLNQVQDDPYPFESPIPANKLDENKHPLRPFLSVRNSFHNINNKKAQEDYTTTEFSKSVIIHSTSNESQSDTTDVTTKGGHKIKFHMSDDTDKITFESSPTQDEEKEHIVFKDSSLSTMNRRMRPDGGSSKQNVGNNSKNIDNNNNNNNNNSLNACYAISQRNTGFKSPRHINYEPKQLKSLDFTLKIAHNSRTFYDNFIFSPLSIQNILALLLLGASEDTFDELSKLLTVGGGVTTADEAETFHKDFSQVLYILNNCTSPKILIETANEIFTDKKYPLNQEYQDNASKYYGALATDFDFKANGEAFKNHVNAWVRERTKGKINTIIDSPPSPLTTLALVNAIYFQGSWEVPFASHITRDGIFHVDKEITTTVKLMTNILEIPYQDSPTYEMIRLPYKGGDTGLYIILPKEVGLVAVSEVEKSLSMQSLTAQVGAMMSQEPSMVTVKLPKMRVQSDGHIKDILLNLGIETLFNATTANFSNISPTPGLHVSSLLHRAIVDINEKGTEGAAVTVATGDRTIGANPVTFIVNRPFIFFIHNSLAESILFWGRVTTPEPLDD